MKDVIYWSFKNGISDKVLTWSNDGTMRLWDLNNYSAKIRCAYSGNAIPISSHLSDEIIISGWSDGKIRSFVL